MYLPLFFKSREINCLVVGAGQIAAHKVRILIEASSQVTVIAPEAEEEIKLLADASRLKWVKRGFQSGDCHPFNLVIAATSQRHINRLVSLEAQSMNIPVNVVDDPELCSVVFSAVWHEGPLIVAVSTSGRAPFLASEIRNRIAATGHGWGYWVDSGNSFREAVRKTSTDPQAARELLSRFAKVGPQSSMEEPNESADLSEWLVWLEEIEEKRNNEAKK